MNDRSDYGASRRNHRTSWLARQLQDLVRRVRELGWKGALVGLGALILWVNPIANAADNLFSVGHRRCVQFDICDPPPTLPPDTLVGSLTEVRLGAKVPQAAAWLERGLPTPVSLTAEDAAWPGQLITYRVEFRGFGSTECSVKWTLLDAATGERVVDNQYGWKTVHATAYPDSKWTVEATEEDVNIGLMWIPYVATGSFVIEVELLDPSGVHLDIERTPPFTVLEGILPV